LSSRRIVVASLIVSITSALISFGSLLISHEIGHVLQLQHVGNVASSSQTNLMCGPAGNFFVLFVERFISCGVSQMVNLTDEQVSSARKFSLTLVKPVKS